MFIRNENLQSFLRHYPVVSAIVIINLLVFFIIHFIPYVGQLLAKEMIGVNIYIQSGDYWRLITPIFLHTAFMHVLFNSFSTVLFAPALEKILGRWKFIVVYLGAGVIANVADFYLQGPFFTHLGSSGAVFGLFGIYMYMLLFRKDLIDRMSSQMIIIIILFALVMTFIGQNIDILAHLFGLIGGLLLAPPLLSRVPLHFSWRPDTVERRHPRTFSSSDPWARPRRIRGDAGRKIFWGILGLFIFFGVIAWLLQLSQ